MSSRRRAPAMRRLAAAVLILLAATSGEAVALHGDGAAATSVSPLSAGAWTTGYCTNDSDVTVVVDFSQLDHPNDGRPDYGIVVRCAAAPVSSGVTALQQVGFPPEGTTQFGLAYICRVAGRPAADETLIVDGKPYTEQCQQTPPASAYWGYWTAPNAGDWTYSSTGAGSHHPIAGGFEGWSFALNGKSVPPAIEPVRPGSTAPAPSPSPHTPRPHDPGPTNDPSPTSAPPGNAQPGAGQSGDKPPASVSPPAPTPAATATASPPITHSASPGPKRRTGPGRGGGRAAHRPRSVKESNETTPVDPSYRGRATDGAIVSGELPPGSTPAQSPGSPLPTLLGLGALTLLAVGAGATAWRRSRRV